MSEYESDLCSLAVPAWKAPFSLLIDLQHQYDRNGFKMCPTPLLLPPGQKE